MTTSARPLTLADLSERERRLCALVMQSASNAEIAADLGISLSVVTHDLTALYRRLGIGSRLELALWTWERLPKTKGAQ